MLVAKILATKFGFEPDCLECHDTLWNIVHQFENWLLIYDPQLEIINSEKDFEDKSQSLVVSSLSLVLRHQQPKW